MKKLIKTQVGRFIAGVMALLLVVGVCLGVGSTRFLHADLTPQQVMKPSSNTVDVLKSLQQDVEIYYLATDVDAAPWVDELGANYNAIGSRVSYRRIAPDGSEAKGLAALAGGTVAANNLLVKSGDNCVVLDSTKLYNTTYNAMYYYYYGQQVAETMTFEADELLLNAILYVTDDTLPVIYALTGHGEMAVDGQTLAQIQAGNVRVESLNLEDEALPAEAAGIIINKPAADITAMEQETLQNYLKAGGKLVLLSDYSMPEMPNLEALMASYGMATASNVLVLENDDNYRYGAEYPHYLMPALAEHELTNSLIEAGQTVVMPTSGSLIRSKVHRTGLRVTNLMTTSEISYSKNGTDQVSSLEQAEGDGVGPFTVAMAATEGDTRVVWYAGDCMSSQILPYMSGNAALLTNTLSWMTTLKENVVLESGNLIEPSLTLPVPMIAALFAPALIALVVGLIRRRKAI